MRRLCAAAAVATCFALPHAGAAQSLPRPTATLPTGSAHIAADGLVAAYDLTTHTPDTQAHGDAAVTGVQNDGEPEAKAYHQGDGDREESG